MCIIYNLVSANVKSNETLIPLTSVPYYDVKSVLTPCNCSYPVNLLIVKVFCQTLYSLTDLMLSTLPHKYFSHLRNVLPKFLLPVHASVYPNIVFQLSVVFRRHCLLHVSHELNTQNIRPVFYNCSAYIFLHSEYQNLLL